MLSNQFPDSFHTPKFLRFPKYGLDYSLQNVRLLYISITSEIGFRLITSPHRHYNSHLSKGSSGSKQKCTQFLTPFSGTVFDALSHGAIHFVRSVSFTNLEMEVF